MADEFFRPYFGSGVWVQARAVPGLCVRVMLTNSNSTSASESSQLDRSLSRTAHRRGGCRRRRSSAHVARTATGSSTRRSPRGSAISSDVQPRAALQRRRRRIREHHARGWPTGVNVFETGALAPGVTVQTCELPDPLGRRRHEHTGASSCRRRFTTAGWTASRRTAPCRSAASTTPASTCRARSTRCRRSSSSTPRRRRSSATSGAGFSNSSEYLAGMNFYPVRQPQLPPECPADAT